MKKDTIIGASMTVLFHGALLALCFNGGLKYTYPPPEEKMMVIDFDREPDKIDFTAGPEPRAEVPDPDGEVRLVKRAESSVSGNKANQTSAATPGQDGDVEVPEPVRPQINKRALFPSAANTNKDTAALHTSATPSDALSEGHAAGNTVSGSTDGEPSARLAGRSVVGSLPLPSYNVQKTGRVVVKITVDRDGKVTSAIPGDVGTTVNDRSLWNAAKQAALQAKFTVAASAPVSQEGTITYVFKLE